MKKIVNRSQQNIYIKKTKQKNNKNHNIFSLSGIFFPGINIKNSIQHNLLHQHVKEKNHGIILINTAKTW